METQVLLSSEVEGLDMQALGTLNTSNEELSALCFDHESYTTFEEFLHLLDLLPEKPVRVPMYSLNRNGRVVADKMEKYLAYPAESSSALKEVLKTPRHYLIYKNQELIPRNTDHFELGTFCHSAFLEPTKFDKVRVEPKCNRATIHGVQALIRYYWEVLAMPQEIDLTTLKMQALKDKLEDLVRQAEILGYTFISEENNNIINIVRATYITYGGGILPKIFSYAKPETSMYGKDLSTGLAVKIRPDAILLEENFGLNAIVSFKTTSATSVETFLRDCAKYRYELSEGMYLKVASEVTGRKFTATLMVMIQTVIPFQVAVLFWDAEDLQVGKYKYAQALDIVKQCKDANSWLGFDAKAEEGAHGIIQSKLPDYIKSELLPQYIP